MRFSLRSIDKNSVARRFWALSELHELFIFLFIFSYYSFILFNYFLLSLSFKCKIWLYKKYNKLNNKMLKWELKLITWINFKFIFLIFKIMMFFIKCKCKSWFSLFFLFYFIEGGPLGEELILILLILFHIEVKKSLIKTS